MVTKLALIAVVILSFLVAAASMGLLLYSVIRLLSTIEDRSRRTSHKVAAAILPLLLFTPAFQPPEKHKYIKRFYLSLVAFLISFGLALFIQSRNWSPN
ncbi:hypothetical protein [Pelagibius marinus]|uniref:hypothetical protein n=1 Tax=Pelagibius marinus TaxID=2762760 RepID=UPI001872BFCE|nr:hypothetical protein [Pelagibius marinus]